jgi:hypothetical protein
MTTWSIVCLNPLVGDRTSNSEVSRKPLRDNFFEDSCLGREGWVKSKGSGVLFFKPSHSAESIELIEPHQLFDSSMKSGETIATTDPSKNRLVYPLDQRAAQRWSAQAQCDGEDS